MEIGGQPETLVLEGAADSIGVNSTRIEPSVIQRETF